MRGSTRETIADVIRRIDARGRMYGADAHDLAGLGVPIVDLLAWFNDSEFEDQWERITTGEVTNGDVQEVVYEYHSRLYQAVHAFSALRGDEEAGYE